MSWDWFASIAAFCFITSGLPQVWLCLKQGHARGVSALFMWIWLIGEACLFVHAGFGLHWYLPYLANASLSGIVCLIILFYIYFPQDRRKS